MKKIIFPALFLNLISLPLLTQWQTYQIVSQSIRFYDVSVVTPSIIWCCGDSAKVYRTTNGGVSWIASNNGLPLNGTCLKITAVDGLTAWIHHSLGSDRLFATTNGGLNWTEQFFAPVTFINKLHFFNSNTGYIISDNPQGSDTVGFFVTRNGGQNWIRAVNSPVISPGYFIRDNGPQQTDTNFLWFFAEKNSPLISRFYKLTGGLNNQWQFYDVNICQCDMAVFKNTSEGLATDGLNIYSTTNGGINWILKLSGSAGSPTCDFILVPQSNFVLHNTPWTSRISYDYCSSWEPVRNYSMMNFSDAKDTGSVWISGFNGQLLKYNFSFIGITQISSEVPVSFSLSQNYPNPFNPVTSIQFDIPKSSFVRLSVYDITGREIEVLANENLSAGRYEVKWGAGRYSSGVYFYRLLTDGFVQTRKMLLIK